MKQQIIDPFTASDNSNHTKAEEFVAFSGGWLSLDRSVWYSDQLMTFLDKAEDTHIRNFTASDIVGVESTILIPSTNSPLK